MILSVAVLFLQLCAFVFLHALPSPLLRYWLDRLLSRGEYRFIPTFSGRSALFVIAAHLRKTVASPVALLPDYVCNIVHRAFIMAGWQVMTYRTNEILEADWQELLTIIDERKVGVLVGASVFGSSALLGFLSDPSKRLQLKERDIQVIIDVAQDIRLIDKIPTDCSGFLHAVVSFNDKSFPGAMGGGILSKTIHKYDSRPVSFRDKVKLYRWFIGKSLHSVRKSKIPSFEGYKNRYDYSSCDTYPYKIEPLQPIKLQLVLGIIGIYSLPYYQIRKKKVIKYGLHLKTTYSETSAYLVISDKKACLDQLVRGRKVKYPYATEHDPNVSLRPHDVILHNKGFLDEC